MKGISNPWLGHLFCRCIYRQAKPALSLMHTFHCSVPPHLAVVIHGETRFRPVSKCKQTPPRTHTWCGAKVPKNIQFGSLFCCCPRGHPVCISTTNHTVSLAYCSLNSLHFSRAVGKENQGTTSSLLLRHFWCRLLSGNTTTTEHSTRWHTLPIFSYNSAISSILNLKGEVRILRILFKLKKDAYQIMNILLNSLMNISLN